jgi:hypothetical protein
MKPFCENYQFKTFSVRGMELPSVMLGTSPFIGAGQFGAKAMLYHTQFFIAEANLLQNYVLSDRMGACGNRSDG